MQKYAVIRLRHKNELSLVAQKKTSPEIDEIFSKRKSTFRDYASASSAVSSIGFSETISNESSTTTLGCSFTVAEC